MTDNKIKETTQKPLEYKYQKELCENGFDTFKHQLKPLKIKGYRFVFDNMNHPENFLPVFKKNPLRKNSSSDCKSKCKGYALSFYNSVKSATSNYYELLSRKKNIHKQLGTHLAEGYILEEDGTSDGISANGHISMFEYVTTDFKSKFSISKTLYEDNNWN